MNDGTGAAASSFYNYDIFTQDGERKLARKVKGNWSQVSRSSVDYMQISSTNGICVYGKM